MCSSDLVENEEKVNTEPEVVNEPEENQEQEKSSGGVKFTDFVIEF